MSAGEELNLADPFLNGSTLNFEPIAEDISNPIVPAESEESNLAESILLPQQVDSDSNLSNEDQKAFPLEDQEEAFAQLPEGADIEQVAQLEFMGEQAKIQETLERQVKTELVGFVLIPDFLENLQSEADQADGKLHAREAAHFRAATNHEEANPAQVLRENEEGMDQIISLRDERTSLDEQIEERKDE